MSLPIVPEPLVHNHFDNFEVGLWASGGLCIVCIHCTAAIVAKGDVYLSYLTRAAEQHLRVCSVVNAAGLHALPGL